MIEGAVRFGWPAALPAPPAASQRWISGFRSGGFRAAPTYWWTALRAFRLARLRAHNARVVG